MSQNRSVDAAAAPADPSAPASDPPPAVDSPPPAAAPPTRDDDPRTRLHEIVRELTRARSRRAMLEYLRLRRAAR